MGHLGGYDSCPEFDAKIAAQTKIGWIYTHLGEIGQKIATPGSTNFDNARKNSGSYSISTSNVYPDRKYSDGTVPSSKNVCITSFSSKDDAFLFLDARYKGGLQLTKDLLETLLTFRSGGEDKFKVRQSNENDLHADRVRRHLLVRTKENPSGFVKNQASGAVTFEWYHFPGETFAAWKNRVFFEQKLEGATWNVYLLHLDNDQIADAAYSYLDTEEKPAKIADPFYLGDLQAAFKAVGIDPKTFQLPEQKPAAKPAKKRRAQKTVEVSPPPYEYIPPPRRTLSPPRVHDPASPDFNPKN